MRHRPVFQRLSVRLLLAGTGLPAIPQPVRPAEVKLMTYNVESPGWNQQRLAQVVETIDTEAPDVLGLHEASPFRNGLRGQHTSRVFEPSCCSERVPP